MSRFRYLALDAFARRLGPVRSLATATAVYSPGHLGDLLHVIPMLRVLREQRPDIKLIWLVGPWSETLARRYAHLVDELLVFGPNLPPFTRGQRNWRQGFWRQWRLAMGLRRHGVDIFIAPVDGVARFLANAMCPRLWIGIGDWRPPRVRGEVETRFQPYEKDRYEVDALAGVLQAVGISASVMRLEYAVTEPERRQAADFLKHAGVESGCHLGLIAPGSGWSGKNWLPERFGQVAAALASEQRFQVAWIGSESERVLVPASRRGDLNWMGKTSLPMLGAIMEKADIFIGNDAGLLHLAAALDVPTVSIWGPTSPGKWGPKGAIHRQIRKVDRCAGCVYWDYRKTCRHDHACMRAIPVADVLAAISGVLQVSRSKATEASGFGDGTGRGTQVPMPSKSTVDR